MKFIYEMQLFFVNLHSEIIQKLLCREKFFVWIRS